jgi:hypothetical protein
MDELVRAIDENTIAHIQCSLKPTLPTPQPGWTAVTMLEKVQEALTAFRRSTT